MAIAFTAGTSVEGTGSATSTTVSLPAGMADGDYTIVFISVNASSANITTPTAAGWTAILPDTNSANGSTSMAHAIFYRKWVSGDGDLVISHSSGRACATPVKVSGADGTTFVDTAASVTQAASGATTIVAPTITPTSTALVCVFTGRDANNGDVLDPWTNLSSGLTKIAEANGRAATQTNAGHCIAYEIVTADSATGTRQADAAQPTTGAFGVSFALTEAAGGDPPGEATVQLSGEGTLSATIPGQFTEHISNFDDGTDGIWTPNITGNGTVTVTTASKHDGIYGVSANVPASSGDRANLSTDLSAIASNVQQATISGWWRVDTEGASSGSNVPFARFFEGAQRLADVYRQNQQGGANLWLRVVEAAGGSNYTFIPTGYTMPLDTWVYISFTWGLDGVPWLWVDGVQYLGPSDQVFDFFAADSIDTAYLGSQESGNQGEWSMDTITLGLNTAFNDSMPQPLAAEGSFSGSGTLSATAEADESEHYDVDGTFSGSGTLTASVTVAVEADAALSGSGTLTASQSVAFEADAGLSGEGTLEAAQDSANANPSVNLSGTGTLTRSVVANFSASMSSSGEGTLAVSEVHAATQAVGVFSGSGTLTSSNTPAISKSVGLSGSGTLSSTQEVDIAIGVDLGGEGTLTAQSSNSFTSNASLSGEGTLSATTNVSLSASAAFSGSGTLTAGTTLHRTVDANLSASGALASFLTSVGTSKTVHLSGAGGLTVSVVKGNNATGLFSGTGTLSKAVTVDLFTTCDRDGFGTLVAVAESSSRTLSAQLSGVGTLTADIGTRHDYEFTAELASKRWNADVGLKRWDSSI